MLGGAEFDRRRKGWPNERLKLTMPSTSLRRNYARCKSSKNCRLILRQHKLKIVAVPRSICLLPFVIFLETSFTTAYDQLHVKLPLNFQLIGRTCGIDYFQGPTAACAASGRYQ